MKNILITGGCGYTGTVLTNLLIKKGFKVKIIDTQWFGKYLKPNKNLKIIKKDIRKLQDKDFKKIHTIVHLANIANDPSVELNSELSWDVNVVQTQQIMEKAVKNKVKHIIYASSGSVYGVKKEKKVTENLSLKPISTYNKTKMIAERVILSFKDKIKIHIIRPATVCGYSPRMRLDVSVNMLTYQALKNGEMTIFGGNQVRPNIHVKDLANIYYHFIKKNNKAGIYNAGFENLKIIDIAKKIKKIIPSKIKIFKNNNDPRSYRQNSEKLLKTGFKINYSVIDAIKEIKIKFFDNKFKSTDKCYTVKWMKKLDL